MTRRIDIGRERHRRAIEQIEVDRIETGARLRPLDESWARDLGQRMLADGQSEPIDIAPGSAAGRYRLVCGAHRLEAATRYRGLSPIEALILDPAIARQRIEILVARHGENGAPTAGAPALAADIHALLDIAEEPAHADRFDRIAQLLGLDAGKAKRLIDLHAKIPAHIVAMLDDVAIDLAQLEALARLDPAEQEKVAYLLLGGAGGIAEAVDRLRKRMPDRPRNRRIDAFVSLFEQMSLAEKEAALIRLSSLAPRSIAIRWTAGGP